MSSVIPRKIEIVEIKLCCSVLRGRNPAKGTVTSHKCSAAFKNPEFYSNQAMRMPTDENRELICCAEILLKTSVRRGATSRTSEQFLLETGNGDVNDRGMCKNNVNRGNKYRCDSQWQPDKKRDQHAK